MTKTFLALGFILLFLQGYATNVSGLISTNTTWTKANSPYIVTGNIAIDSGATLTVEPGVTIKFDGYYFFKVYGRLSMLGTVRDTIKVTSNKSTPVKGDYPGIELQRPTYLDTAIFNYCHFSFAYDAINTNGISVSIKHTSFINCTMGITNSATNALQIKVDSCYFNRNYCGVYNTGFASAYVTNSTILNSSAHGLYSINFNSNSYAANNVIYNCGAGILKYNIVKNNIITHCVDFGVGVCGDVRNNQIWYCGTGVYECLDVQHNGIEYNNVGFQFSYGEIHYNCITNCKKAFVEMVNYDVNMSNNYWGTIDSNSIANGITDFYDVLIGGRVTFMPLLTSRDSGCADTVSIPDTTTNSTSIAFTNTSSQLKVYPNPSSAEVTIAAPSAINEIAVYNMTGERIISITPVTNTVQINISHLPAGYYLYKVVLKNEETIIGKIQRE